MKTNMVKRTNFGREFEIIVIIIILYYHVGIPIQYNNTLQQVFNV